MVRSQEQGGQQDDSGRYRHRHPEWERELISLPDNPEATPQPGTAGSSETPEQQRPQLAPEELLPALGDIALRVS